MTERLDPVDVVIVGLGAAGGIAAHVLTDGGLRVAALEAGPHVDSTMMTLDEVRNDVRAWLSEPKSAHEIPTWRTDADATALPSPYPMKMVNAVGGTAIHYEGASLRFHPWHFESRTDTGRRHYPKPRRSPTGR